MDEYYYWLIDFIDIDGWTKSYQKLLHKLFYTEFTFCVDFDKNRANDGLYLRDEFCFNGSIDPVLKNTPCSILEMMIALAQKCEDLIYDQNQTNIIGELFIDMLHNLNIYSMDDWEYDEHFVNKKLYTFLNRKYSIHGNGNIFKIKGLHSGFNTMDLWMQANIYLSEKYIFV